MSEWISFVWFIGWLFSLGVLLSESPSTIDALWKSALLVILWPTYLGSAWMSK